jgi:hypothetical protein
MSGGMCEIGGDMTRLNPEKKKFFDTVIDFFSPSEKCVNNLLLEGVGNLPVSHIKQERRDAVFDAYLNWNEYPCEFHAASKGNDLWSGKDVGKNEAFKLKKHAPFVIKQSYVNP